MKTKGNYYKHRNTNDKTIRCIFEKTARPNNVQFTATKYNSPGTSAPKIMKKISPRGRKLSRQNVPTFERHSELQ